MSTTLSDQEVIRRRSLQGLTQLGINPYPAETFDVNSTVLKITNNFTGKPEAFQNVVIAGRIMNRRIMGNVSFVEIQDSTGRLQIYIKRDEICKGDDNTWYNIALRLAKIISRYKTY